MLFANELNQKEPIKRADVFLINKNNEKELVNYNKMLIDIEKLINMDDRPPLKCDGNLVVSEMKMNMCDSMHIKDVVKLLCEVTYFKGILHPDYMKLSSRVYVQFLHKNTYDSFLTVATSLYEHKHPVTKLHSPLISKSVYEYICKNFTHLQSTLDYSRDYDLDYFGLKTLEYAYLIKINDVIVERPQHLFMRVAIGIHHTAFTNPLGDIITSYNYMSMRVFSHATPTLFNAGTNKPQMSSCFLMDLQGDSIKGIFNTVLDCAEISKHAGGIGIAMHNLRSKGSYIAGSNGKSSGIVPVMKVLDATACYVDQGGGKRKGSFAVYLEPWHADILEFLDLKKNTGSEEARARNLFYGLWVPDLFMRRVEARENWTLFCPSDAKGLSDVYGKEFDELYIKYESSPDIKKQTIPADKLFEEICFTQVETGVPYMLYKDACNEKSNQKNLGTIKSSNLCCEIVEYADESTIAVCNLASLNLKAFIKKDSEGVKFFDYNSLRKATAFLVKSLDRIIDSNYYVSDKTSTNNFDNRPIGIGVQGLADTFHELKLVFDSAKARQLNRDIFENIYYAACRQSVSLSILNKPYKNFKGSPISEGKFQFDLWNKSPNSELNLDWDGLRKDVITHGIRNSLLTALMPTASTSHILGNSESFEPYTSNIYSQKVLSGDFMIVNRYLVEELENLNMWTPDVVNKIFKNFGSVQELDFLSKELKERFRTVWEVKQRSIIEMAADRAIFIDQSQSMNIYLKNPTVKVMYAVHITGWKAGLKTGLYYLKADTPAKTTQFTVESTHSKTTTTVETECEMCTS